MSSAVNEDTARAIHTGRETLGAMFSSAQTHLQKVFIVFVLGFLGSFWALRMYIWDFLEETAKAEMTAEVAEATNIITRTPFEVILLQAKIGLLVGAIVAVPALLYFSRDALRRRGVQSAVPVSRGYLVGFVLASVTLFWIGVAYAYAVFFPFAFNFLGAVAHDAGVNPSWGITEFTEFIALLTLSFGLAAQLPLFMSVLSYTEIVSYETFRDKWRHAIVAITVFGALFSPPDPFTLIMWALPLVGLYVFSLGLAKIVANMRRRGAAELDTGTKLVKRRVLQFVGALGVVTVATATFVNQDGFDHLEESVYPLFPDGFRPEGTTGLEAIALEYGVLGDAAAGLIVAAVVGFVVLVGYTAKVLRSPVYPREDDIRTAEAPDDIDFETLAADDIEDVPAPVFLAMDEEEALEYSREALYDENREKAQAILDRFDTLQEQAEDAAEDASSEGTGTAVGATDSDDAAGGSVFSSTAAGMLDPFTEDETTEDDIGGYAYDLAFIVDSLTSKTIYIVGVFMAVLGGSFLALYQGGFGIILAQFVDRVPPEVLDEVTEDGANTDEVTSELVGELGLVIALHPVEVLIFMVKVSTILAFIAIAPMILYWAWPAAKERGLVYGDPRVFLVWGGALFVGFGVGLFLGFYWIAPAVISYLITDAIANGMEVTYRINSFSWLVIYTTLGIGFLFNIIVTMALFHVGGIISYRTMLERWRPVVVGIFTIAAFASPKGILTMLLLAFPIALTYLLGLAILYVFTAGGRLFGGGGGKRKADPDSGLLSD
ncbi:twin-arginine translocase subunit TatC [Natrarchaeobaculum sulfurireducens]|uniref:Sec-independent protein translocase protein TatC n=1 Tax=Natrarchaeobaculum sulfurireducens TaxID=2044521 RepID=A0A346PAD0_9EURY|nr:twin-arginine translocase subunit TatC [Natrarchaeobaculum sulfurireducens]AXR76475.1 Sec-independent protein secretion pathway component TatC [Natrarchaeobaculum sulfurireducens]AXR80151.1 Twin-arginine translocation protein TatC [Natrarchaeobaculum sulfurireducens]